MDVTDAASIRKAAAQLDDVALDLVINSAGITGVSGQRAGNVDYALPPVALVVPTQQILGGDPPRLVSAQQVRR
jgi:NAD(P)-dependent dehydrogenase (short-subunit alcohol dehydrogenase family)